MTQNEIDDDYDWPLISSTCAERAVAGRGRLAGSPVGLPTQPGGKLKMGFSPSGRSLAKFLRQVPPAPRGATDVARPVDELDVLRWWMSAAGIDLAKPRDADRIPALLALCRSDGLTDAEGRPSSAGYGERFAVAVALYRCIRRSADPRGLVRCLRVMANEPPVRGWRAVMALCLRVLLGDAPGWWTDVDTAMFAELNMMAATFVKDWTVEEVIGAIEFRETPGKLAACQWVWQCYEARRARGRAAARDPRNADYIFDLLGWLSEEDDALAVVHVDEGFHLVRETINPVIFSSGRFAKVVGDKLEVPLPDIGPAMWVPKPTWPKPTGRQVLSRLLVEQWR
jgi:hypothetical protein